MSFLLNLTNYSTCQNRYCQT